VTRPSTVLLQHTANEATIEGHLHDRLLIFRLSGRPHDSGFSELEDRMRGALEKHDWDGAVLDLTEAACTCSFLMRFMMRADRLAAQQDHRFVTVATPGSPVEERLLLSRMDQLVTIAPDIASARQLTRA
jgi:hypothetical protein